MRFKVSLPAASIGAKCFSVVSLHANGREDSLAAKTWLICGSVHPPLFALSSFLQMPIPFTNRCKYAAICEIVSALSGFCIIRLPVNCSYNSHYEKLDGVERCIDDEPPFEIPENWCWVRFGTALVNRDAERIPLSVSQREKLDKKYDYYGASGVIDKVDRYLFDKPLLLVGEDGANLLLRSKPIAFIASGQYWVNNHAHVIDAVAGVDLRYIALFINATNLAPYVTGTAQPKMNQEKLNSILVPLPPTNEQRRIVSAFEGIAAIIQQS